MARVRYLVVAVLAAASAMTACEAQLGDACTTSSACPTGTVCDTDSPGGYCLVYNCEADEECPEEGTCVAFTAEQRYCLKKCGSNSDCRGGYACRADLGGTKFCYVAPGASPYGRKDDNEVEFTAPE